MVVQGPKVIPNPVGPKPWWQSKTVWLQVAALGAAVAQARWGWVAPPEYQAVFLTVATAALRFITRRPITLS